MLIALGALLLTASVASAEPKGDVAAATMKWGQTLPINADQVVAHELGHAFYWYSHRQGVLYSDAADDQTSLDWENAVRDLPYYRQRHYP